MSDVKAATTTIVTPGKKVRPYLVDLIVRLVKQKPLGTFGGIMVLLMFFIGIAAPLVAPYPPNATNADAILAPPSTHFLLGTDNLGRDLLTRIIYGARISVSVGLAVPAIQIVVALLIGLPSGFKGGKYDIIIQRFIDGWMCIPNFLMLITLMSLIGPGLLKVILVLGIAGGITMSRTIRGTVISIRTNTYVQAAEALGTPTWKTLLRHILPNIMPVVIVLFTMGMASSILQEANLSFLGFGVPPPNPTWGGMLSQDGRRYMMISPGIALWPGLALSVVVYSISMLGDAIRDLQDPRLKGGAGSYVRKARPKRHLL